MLQPLLDRIGLGTEFLTPEGSRFFKKQAEMVYPRTVKNVEHD